MKPQSPGDSIVHRLSKIWEGLVEPTQTSKTGENRSIRALNISLLFLIIWGILAEMQYRLGKKPLGVGDLLTIGLILCFSLSYFLNRRGHFRLALILTITALTCATLVLALILHLQDQSNFSVLYYLIIAISMSELFFSIRGYILSASLILIGVLGIYLLDKNAGSAFGFLLVFSALVGFSGYSRRLIETERTTRASRSEQNQSLLRIERRRARQMELLNEITNTMLQMPDLHQALQTLADQLAQLMEADGAFITLWDEASGRVLPATAYGDYRDTYSSMKLDPGENTLTAAVLREGRTLPIEDVLHTQYMNPQLASDVPSRSALALPLIASDRKLGAAIISFNQPHQFTLEEIAIGEQAAGQIALAVFKAQLYDTEVRRAKQLALLEEVGRQIADSLDENEIIHRTVEIIVHHFRYAEVAISLLIEDNLLEVAAINGTQDFGYRLGYQQKVGQGIIGYAGEKGEPYIVNDVSQDPYYLSTAKRKGSALAVPMFNKEELLGIIYVETASRNDFKSDDVQTLQTLANQVATAIQKARLYARAQEHIQGMTTLQTVSAAISSSLELNEILRNIIEILKTSYGYHYISIYLLEGNILRLGTQLGYPDELIINEIPITSGVVGRTVRTKETQLVLDVNNDPAFMRASYEVKSEICVPLLKYDRVLGVLNVESKAENPLNENDLNLLNAIAGPLAVAIDNARLHAEVKAMALTDAMCGLANRRAFDEMLHTELMRAHRYNNSLSLIIMDLDSFKLFNDLYGHPAGDVRLKEIAEMLKENVREPDIAARYGGEEFAVILPNTNKRGAMKLAQRLCKSAEAKAPIPRPKDSAISGYTLSLGVATFPDDGVSEQDLLLAADNAELNAKRLGKNRVCAADSMPNTSD